MLDQQKAKEKFLCGGDYIKKNVGLVPTNILEKGFVVVFDTLKEAAENESGHRATDWGTALERMKNIIRSQRGTMPQGILKKLEI